MRHPWDLIFEEDLPEYEHFMKARRTAAFRERKRFELRQEARASRTLRRYGFCEADCWSREEAALAEELVKGLRVVADEQRGRLRHSGKAVDADTFLWRDVGIDFEGELAAEVERAAAGDEERKRNLARVADRLLDRVRLRFATREERTLASELLDGIGDEDLHGGQEDVLKLALARRAEEVAGDDRDRLEDLSRLTHQMLRRILDQGRWDEVVEDVVPAEIQPLHMSAVKEALGALIPERLHKSFDRVVKQGKDDFGVLRGGSVLHMAGWRVSVRAEDFVARGRLQEDALEFFLLALRHICKCLKLPIAVGSKTVGREVGRQETPGNLVRVMEKWRKVWMRDEVRKQQLLVMPVALDDGPSPQVWHSVVVRSCVQGEELGAAQRLRVELSDPTKGVTTGERVARNADALVRGVGARLGVGKPEHVFVGSPEGRVGSQLLV